jgi:hypothetical protein
MPKTNNHVELLRQILPHLTDVKTIDIVVGFIAGDSNHPSHWRVYGVNHSAARLVYWITTQVPDDRPHRGAYIRKYTRNLHEYLRLNTIPPSRPRRI